MRVTVRGGSAYRFEAQVCQCGHGDMFVREPARCAGATRDVQTAPRPVVIDWTPHPKSMTLGRLAWHVVAIPSIAVRLINAGRFDIANAGPPQMPENPEFVETFRRNLQAIRETLAGMDDAALKAPFVISRNGDVLNQPPKIVFIRQIMMNHTYHHRGQLSVYLRLLDVPLPAIYGTTADEGM